jgi:hypothetical protein
MKYLLLISIFFFFNLNDAHTSEESKLTGVLNFLTSWFTKNDSEDCKVDTNPYETATWEVAGLHSPSFKDIPLRQINQKEITHVFDLDIVVLRGSGWDTETIEQRYLKVAEIFAQCGIGIPQAKVIEVDPPDNQLDFSKEEISKVGRRSGEAYSLVDSIPSENITAIHIRAFEDRNTSLATLERRYGKHSPYSNKTWIVHNCTSDEYKESRLPGYSPEAHELAHILLKMDYHNSGLENNIMANDFDKRTPEFTDNQCEIMRSHPLVQEL